MSIYNEMSEGELAAQLEDARRELMELRFEYGLNRSIQNPARIRHLKRSIARILTVQNLPKADRKGGAKG